MSQKRIEYLKKQARANLDNNQRLFEDLQHVPQNLMRLSVETIPEARNLLVEITQAAQKALDNIDETQGVVAAAAGHTAEAISLADLNRRVIGDFYQLVLTQEFVLNNDPRAITAYFENVEPLAFIDAIGNLAESNQERFDLLFSGVKAK